MFDREQYETSKGWVTCNHLEEMQRPCKYEYSNGSIHYGYQCLTCGGFTSKPRSHFQIRVPKDWFDKSIKERFREFANEHWERTSLQHQQKLAEFYARFPFEEWRDRYESYIESEEWKGKSEYTKARDPVCRLCNSKASVHTHHVTYKRLGFEAEDDLIGVCYECHSKHHSHMEILNINWDDL